VLANLAERYTQLGTAQERSAFLNNALGRSGRALAPLFAQGAAGIAQMEHEADKLGLTLSQGVLDSTFKLSVAQREMGEAFKGAAVSIGVAFIPIATRVVLVLTGLVELISKIPTPVLAIGAAFFVVTGALAAIMFVIKGVVATWTGLAAVLHLTSAAQTEQTLASAGSAAVLSTEAVAVTELSAAEELLAIQARNAAAAQAELAAASEAGVLGTLGALALFAAPVVAIFAAVAVGIHAARQEEAAFAASVARDKLLLLSGAVPSANVRTLAALTPAQIGAQARAQLISELGGPAAVAQLTGQRTPLRGPPDLPAQLVFEHSQQIQQQVDAARQAIADYEHAMSVLGQTAAQTGGAIRKTFSGVTDATAPLNTVGDAVLLLNKNLGDASGKLSTFAKFSGADVKGILGGISSVVNNAKSTIDDVVAAYQDGIDKLKAANAAWHDSIVQAFGGAGSALDAFANKSNVHLGKAVEDLASYTAHIQTFGTNIATIQDRFGKKASDFIAWASTQGLAQQGLVRAVAAGNDQMAGSFISNFNKANTATSTLASQIQKALDPMFQHIIDWLKNVVLAIQGVPPIKIGADISPALRALGLLQVKLDSIIGREAAAGITSLIRSGRFQPGTFHQGGVIGAGIPRYHSGALANDEVPAILQRGEYVLRSASVAKIGIPALQAMNRMHEGGSVARPARVLASVGAVPSGRSEQASGLRGPVSIEGTLTLSPDGTAYIRGIAKDEIDRETRWRNN